MPSVPILPAATVVVLRRTDPVEVALLTRRARSSFVGGMTVFPGGGLDHDDHAAVWAEAHTTPRVDHLPLTGALAYWVAAVRETWEEAAIFLGEGELPADQRHRVDQGAVPFSTVVAATGARLHLDRLSPIGRWITPAGAPRRYDTAFFLTSVDADTALEPDGTEAVAADWVTLHRALDEATNGDRPMLAPTSETLRVLASYTDPDHLLSTAAGLAPLTDRHRLHRTDHATGSTYHHPGEPVPDGAVPAEGWMALPLARFAP